MPGGCRYHDMNLVGHASKMTPPTLMSTSIRTAIAKKVCCSMGLRVGIV